MTEVSAGPFTEHDSGADCERLEGVKHLHRPVLQICCAAQSIVLLANADADMIDSPHDGDTLTNRSI